MKKVRIRLDLHDKSNEKKMGQISQCELCRSVIRVVRPATVTASSMMIDNFQLNLAVPGVQAREKKTTT